MNDVASRELSKELEEVSGWKTPTQLHVYGGGTYQNYTLGYLLRKLPKVQASTGSMYKYQFVLTVDEGKFWKAGYPFNEDFTLFAYGVADTPEDALCKLAIELFKQGILTKELA